MVPYTVAEEEDVPNGTTLKSSLGGTVTVVTRESKFERLPTIYGTFDNIDLYINL